VTSIGFGNWWDISHAPFNGVDAGFGRGQPIQGLDRQDRSLRRQLQPIVQALRLGRNR
jgi:hypothetical protein